jgi:hypothetical protein
LHRGFRNTPRGTSGPLPTPGKEPAPKAPQTPSEPRGVASASDPAKGPVRAMGDSTGLLGALSASPGDLAPVHERERVSPGALVASATLAHGSPKADVQGDALAWRRQGKHGAERRASRVGDLPGGKVSPHRLAGVAFRGHGGRWLLRARENTSVNRGSVFQIGSGSSGSMSRAMLKVPSLAQAYRYNRWIVHPLPSPMRTHLRTYL